MEAQNRIRSGNFIMNTDITRDKYIHTMVDQNGNPIDNVRTIEVPTDISIKMQCAINGYGSPSIFFNEIGCINAANGNIDMYKLNLVKQYLDMIKDGASPVLMRKLMGSFLTERQIPVQFLKYPATLDAIKEYFNKHYDAEGKLHKVFWERHGDFPGFPEILNSPAIHDCGFKPDRPFIIGPSTGIDPLEQGKIKDKDIIFPGKTSQDVGSITWTDNTLLSLGYPPGCSIKATNNGGGEVGGKVNWSIEVVCSVGNMRVIANDRGIYDNNTGHPISIKDITTIKDLKQGNTFKSYIQSQTSDKNTSKKKNPTTILLILLALVFIKSFGDNSIDLTQRSAALFKFPIILFTCDFTLFLSAKTSGAGMAVLTTNAPDMNNKGRTGNLSTLFLPMELTPKDEIESIFNSCQAENMKYLTMLKQLYSGYTDTRTVKIKIGGEIKDIHLWFVYIIIKAIETCMDNHSKILEKFIDNTKDMPKEQWVSHKNDILSLFKSYCKIVFPFVVISENLWRVLAQTTLISNSPQVTSIDIFASSCQTIIEHNKNSLKPQIDSFIHAINKKGKYITIKTINLQQLAVLIGNYATPKDGFDVPNLEGMAAAGRQGGGRNRKSNLTGGMDPTTIKRQKANLAPAAVLAAAMPVVPAALQQQHQQQEAEEPEDEDEQLELEQRQRQLELEQRQRQQQLELEQQQQQQQQQELTTQEAIAVTNTNGFTSIIGVLQGRLQQIIQGKDGQQYLSYEIKKSVYTLIIILVSSCLSQLLKYLSLLITEPEPSGDSAGDYAATAKDNQMSIISATHHDIQLIVAEYKILNMLHVQDEVSILDELVQVMLGLNDIIHGVNKLSLACLYSIFENENLIITRGLLDMDINPSSDNLQFAMLRLNLSIFYNCVNDVRSGKQDSFHKMYRSGQISSPHKDYFPIDLHIGKQTHDDYSFYEEYYSLMKNIAYNVFYTFEYQLPLSCTDEFNLMRQYLINEFNIEIHVFDSDPIHFQAQQNAFMAVSDGDSYPFSPSVSPGVDLGTNAPSNAPPNGVVVDNVLSGGGSSTRSRRKRRHNHRRTQYTNKHKRSSKHNTIKHRKSYRKHNRTIKRRSHRK